MAQADAGLSTDEEALKDVFESAMKLYNTVENANQPLNSDSVQMTIKTAISKFERATRMVSMTGMFSKNEDLDELPTEILQYLLLPALLGSLSLKLCNQPRMDLINVAEIYFRDYLQRCKDYGVTDIEAQTNVANTERPLSEQAKITKLVQTRGSKIKRYKEMKELKEKLSTLTKAMESHADEETKREYFTTMLHSYVNQALDELNSIEQEKPILEYMAKHAGDPKPKEKPRARPLKPVIITKDAVQKAVFGAGYPALPSMTVEEFYDQRVRDGIFPGAGTGTNIPHATIETADADADESEKIRQECLEEEDDEEERARKQDMDEYKDDHRRGWGNRYNRS